MKTNLSNSVLRISILAVLGLASFQTFSSDGISACARISDFDARAQCVQKELRSYKLEFAPYLDMSGGNVNVAAEDYLRDVWSEVGPVLYPNRSLAIQYYVNYGLAVSQPECATYLEGTPAQTKSCLTAFNAVAYGGVSLNNTKTLVLGICGATNTGPVVVVTGLCGSGAGVPAPYAGSVVAVSIPVLSNQENLPGTNCADAVHAPAPVSTGSTRACSSTNGMTLISN